MTLGRWLAFYPQTCERVRVLEHDVSSAPTRSAGGALGAVSILAAICLVPVLLGVGLVFGLGQLAARRRRSEGSIRRLRLRLLRRRSGTRRLERRARRRSRNGRRHPFQRLTRARAPELPRARCMPECVSRDRGLRDSTTASVRGRRSRSRPGRSVPEPRPADRPCRVDPSRSPRPSRRRRDRGPCGSTGRVHLRDRSLDGQQGSVTALRSPVESRRNSQTRSRTRRRWSRGRGYGCRARGP